MQTLLYTTLALGVGACSVDSGVRPRTVEDPSNPSAAVSPYEPTVSTAAAGLAASPLATTYVCPMHADVIRDMPGQCPKCGMTLIPQHPHAQTP